MANQRWENEPVILRSHDRDEKRRHGSPQSTGLDSDTSADNAVGWICGAPESHQVHEDHRDRWMQGESSLQIWIQMLYLDSNEDLSELFTLSFIIFHYRRADSPPPVLEQLTVHNKTDEFKSYGVTRDGRIFFINEEAKSTTWLHPVTGEAVITGHRKTPDLPTGWEEGYTFEGARCFINHNERKVTCKHPVSGVPSQDNCIFVVNEQPAPKASSEKDSSSDKKERPMSTMSEASNYTGGSDYSTFPGSPTTTPSRSSKKVHNFGKRSNSIKRNPNAPVVKSSWLYKQDSTGMKLWKKRWFVLSDMCLFYYRDDKEDNILGSILLPSFHISMLSVDDHISRKYAFKATHPNMRTYYFCTDTAKEMESWMKVMTDAALVHTEPVRRMDKLKVDQRTPQELNNLLNHRVLTRPEIQNNERNREPLRQHSLSRVDDKRQKDNSQREREYYTLQRDGERYSLKKDGVSYTLQKDGERYLLHKDGEKYLLRKDGEKTYLHKDGEVCTIHRELEKYAVQKVDEKYTVSPTEERYAPSKDGEKYLLTKDGEKYALQKVGDRHLLQKDVQKPHKEVKRQLSLKETDRYSTMRADSKYGTIQVVDKYGAVREVKKYATLREGDRYAMLRDAEKYATVRGGDKYGFQRDPSAERTLTKISSIKLQPAQAAAIAAAVSASRQASLNAQKPAQVNGSGSTSEELTVDCSPAEGDPGQCGGTLKSPAPAQESERGLSRTNSMQQLEHWVRTHRTRGADEDARSVTSYQTLPRNMPSHRAQMVPRYPEGYRTLPRNSLMRPDSICSVAGSVYDRALRPASTSTVMTTAEKRRSMRDDTMWQLYEWQQRQAFSRQTVSHYGTLPSTKTMGNISEHAVAHSIPTSPSHGSLAVYSTFSPPRQQAPPNPSSSQSEVSSPVFRGDLTLEPRHRAHVVKYGYQTDRRSIAGSVPAQTITAQSLQGKTPEELTLMLIKLRRQQAELNSLREHTVSQLMALGLEGPNPKTDVLSHHLQRNLIYLESQTKENEPLIFMIHTMIENSAPRPQLYQQISPEDFKDGSFVQRTEEADVDTKLSRLCEQDKAVRMQEEKLQQLHREKHTLETALLSASQELSEQSGSNATATQSLIQQRDVLQNGLLSTCRELTRVSTELERSWREYDRLSADVTLAKSNLLEQLEALGSPQTEPPSQRHIQIQKELWRIQDVMEALAKNKPQRSADAGFPGSKPLSSQQKNEAVTTLPLSPPKEGDPVPPRPPLPQYYDSTERPPQVPPHHPHPGGRLPPHTHRPEDRKASSRNGAHSAPDYRLYKSEPELTTVKEEVDEANGEDKDRTETSTEGKDPGASKAPPHPVGIVPPRTKSPMSPPESSTIASYVTLRKTKKPEPRSQDRPRSAVDQMGFGEREVGRQRMSVEEQLERMRRNQEATSLREKRRETPSRSPSFSKDNPFLTLQTRVQAEGACADPVELEAALQQLKVSHMEQNREAEETNAEQRDGEVSRAEEVKNEECEEVQQEEDVTPQSVKEPHAEANSVEDPELCESQRVVILDLQTEPRRVEIVNFQPFEDDESRDQDLTSSPTNTTTENSFQTPEPETPSPEPHEEVHEEVHEEEVTQQNMKEEKLEKNLDSNDQLTADDKKLNNNNNNMLAAQTFTLVTSDT
ncbi:pleckstrin homology domain-containing family A member 5-like isoform X2 [Xyrichtys novacula]|uniref:Pleckstrin homology domain-containing family A member 5-like isoform X2 n=1 Tax=Xyrichtys novacula TaxID=13765 RepID=A0AAV1F478_XYRNO|nr:pleckstrin homology domain-containing family A member 5-like isoform X2 [Xyrichtys novacula]